MQATDAAVAMTHSDIGMIKTGGSKSTKLQTFHLPGGGLSGRTPEGRKELGDKYGATGDSEEAVEAALHWIAEHQRPNGSWSFDLSLDPCNGQCRHSKDAGDTPTPTTGATGLALLAFLGAGYTQHDGIHAQTIQRGIYYLRSVASETEVGYDWQHGSMYGHAIALMAMSESLAMTTKAGDADSDLYRLVDLGSRFTIAAQHDNGSWGYVPGSPGDTTLSGWQVLSLISARSALSPPPISQRKEYQNGIRLPTHILPRAKDYLLSVRSEDEWTFGYKGRPGEPTTTAIALTLLMYLGQQPGYTPFDRQLDKIAQRGPTLTNVYHDYYATMALHNFRHRDWDKWNTKLRDHLVRTQSKKGHEAGSWHFKDKWGDQGGRLYTTAMSTLILEVYYRFLPLYDLADKEFPL